MNKYDGINDILIPEDAKGNTTHIWPPGDFRVHILSKKCWCHPEYIVNDYGQEFYKHKSMDGREDYETGRRKFH